MKEEVLIHLVLILLNFLTCFDINMPVVSVLGCLDLALSCKVKL